MNNFDTTGRRLPLPKARYETPEPWTDADQKQLPQFLKTPSGAKFLLTLHALVNRRAMTVQECSTHDSRSPVLHSRIPFDPAQRMCNSFYLAGFMVSRKMVSYNKEGKP